MIANQSRGSIELIYLWEDSSTHRKFFTTHLVPQVLLTPPPKPLSLPPVIPQKLNTEIVKEEIKDDQKV